MDPARVRVTVAFRSGFWPVVTTGLMGTTAVEKEGSAMAGGEAKEEKRERRTWRELSLVKKSERHIVRVLGQRRQDGIIELLLSFGREGGSSPVEEESNGEMVSRELDDAECDSHVAKDLEPALGENLARGLECEIEKSSDPPVLDGDGDEAPSARAKKTQDQFQHAQSPNSPNWDEKRTTH